MKGVFVCYQSDSPEERDRLPGRSADVTMGLLCSSIELADNAPFTLVCLPPKKTVALAKDCGKKKKNACK